MLGSTRPIVAGEVGSANAKVLASAYEQAVQIVSLGDHALAPPASARSAMLKAMFGHAKQNGFSRDALILAALAAYPASGRTNRIA